MSHDPAPSTRADRGQLLLVGAIAISIVLLGLVLVMDTALFTQVVGSEGTIETTREGGVAAAELGDALAAVVHEENLDTDLIGTIRPRLSSVPDAEFEAMLVNRSLNSGGALVSVTYLGDTALGSTVSQTDSVGLTNSTGVENWSPVDTGDVGHFNLTVDTAASSGESFEIQVDSVSGGSRTLDVVVAGSGDEVSLSNARASAACGGIEAHDDSVRLDVRHGRVYENASCSFDLFGAGEPPYEVSFAGGADVNATYALVTDRTSFPIDHFGPPGQPQDSAAVWAFEYEFTYDVDDATVESTGREVDVYG